jgi:hypothetical protein
MSINVFQNQIDAGYLRQNQNKQYSEIVLLSDTVPANSTKLGQTAISSLGSFLCQFITGTFNCLYNDQTAVIDQGVCFLLGQLIDSTGNRKLFTDFVPLNLFLSPGRQKDNTAANVQGTAEAGVVNAADPSGMFLNPLEFNYLFSKNSDISMEVKNISNVDLSYNIAFHGILLVNQ